MTQYDVSRDKQFRFRYSLERLIGKFTEWEMPGVTELGQRHRAIGANMKHRYTGVRNEQPHPSPPCQLQRSATTETNITHTPNLEQRFSTGVAPKLGHEAYIMGVGGTSNRDFIEFMLNLVINL